MKKISLLIIVLITLYSCRSNKNIKNNDTIDGISLEANHISNNEFKLIYNSTDTISTTLIVNKTKIEKSKVKSVLDTLKMQNYFFNIDREKRVIELISK